MKYVVILCDGMADESIDELGGLTPLEYAKTPNIDLLAVNSEIGLVKTVPDDMAPGSDTANLSVLGYDPMLYYSGRSPLEALSIGVKMKDTDIAIRTNFVTLSEDADNYEDLTIIDHSAGELSTEEAAILLDAVRKEFENDEFKFYLGTSYRHLLIWNKGEVVSLTQPHDILTQKLNGKLPTEPKLREMMIRSYEILKNHPINVKRKAQGLNPANSIWFWGAGTKPMLDSFGTKFRRKGAMISAVDLLKGIAIGASMDVIEVEGATGGLETNYSGKAKASVDALLNKDYDFVYVHIEATDEMGHQGNLSNKILAIENIDKDVVSLINNELKNSGVSYKIMILPDHPTPIRIRTHSSNPVPYMIYDSTNNIINNELGEFNKIYSEKYAMHTGKLFDKGYKLIEHMFE